MQGGNPRTCVHNVATWKVVNKQLIQSARKLGSAHKLPVDIPHAKELVAFKVRDHPWRLRTPQSPSPDSESECRIVWSKK